MKTSAIALFYLDQGREFLVNLMDSPGHVDFSSEVSTAVRLCDGAILVVDVVEGSDNYNNRHFSPLVFSGVQPQTKVVLKQAWDEGIKPVLVLNKLDRLVLEMKEDTVTAYLRLREVLEQVNALVAEMFTEEVLAKNSEENGKNIDKDISDVFDWSSGLEEADDSNIYFSPELGNVVFCSAYDGWAFSINTFSKIYSSKLGFSERALDKSLWGDYYINKKLKKFVRGANASGKKPLFVSLILDNIWSMYDVVMVQKDKEKLQKMITSLGLSVGPRDLRTTDTRQQLAAVMSAWLPLAGAVLRLVTAQLPAPSSLAPDRAEKLICSRTKRFNSLPAQTQELRQHFESCSAAGPVIVFISKMFPVARSQLPENKARPLTAEELAERREAARARHAQKEAGTEAAAADAGGAVQLTGEQLDQLSLRETDCNTNFIAFARVYSGTLTPGQEVWVIGPKYDPATTADTVEQSSDSAAPQLHIARVKLGSLYILLGRDLETVDEVKAGNIVGISGLSGSVLKSATLSSTPWCPPFVPVHQSTVPIMRVALEPVLSSDLGKLEAGLQLLNQADAHVEVVVSEMGEHIIVTAGEVHLQRCLADLTSEYAGCEVTVSDPIVPFRETIVVPPEMDMVNEVILNVAENEDTEPEVVSQTPNKQSTIKIRAVPLTEDIVKLLDANTDILKAMDKQKGLLTSSTLAEVETLKSELCKLLNNCDTLKEASGRIWSLGPKQYGPNILFNMTDYKSREIWPGSQLARDASDRRSELESSLIQGFQMATLAGPLCEEPMMGVAFVVESWQVGEDSEAESGWGPLSGQIVSMVKECCRESFLRGPVRLMTAMFSCDIMVRTEALGKMYSVVGKRRGRVVREDLIEGSTTFTVTAHIPVIESFNIGPELRKQTSGMAMPQLVFSHWEVLDIDPRWVPSTEEELLHFGEKADTANPALKYVNDIRKRKGLKIDEKIVEFAEKQRTLTKSK